MKKMFEFRRQHPVAALTSTLKIVREHLVKIILLYLVGGQQSGGAFFNLTTLLILVAGLLVWGVISWFRFTYLVKEDTLLIEYGVIVRKKLRIPSKRIQVIDISSGIIQRFFGLVSLKVQTAGQSSEDTEISAVTREEAERIRTELRAEATEKEEEAEEKSRKAKTYKLSFRRLVTAALTSGSIGVALSIIGTIMVQANEILAETRMYKQIAGYFDSVTGFVIMLSAVLLIGGVLLAFVGTLIRFAAFSVRRESDELIIKRGLFERKQMTIPLNRVQSVRLVEGVLRQPFGLLSVEVDSAGYAAEEGRSTVLFPLLKHSEAPAFVREILPEFDLQTAGVAPPLRSLRRYMLKLAVPVLILALIPIYYGWTGSWLLILVPLALWWGYVMWNDAAVGWTSEIVLLRYRRLARTTVLVPRKRVQRLTFEQNWWQRRGAVSDLKVTVASGSTGATFEVQYLATDLETRIYNWLFSPPPAEGEKQGVEARSVARLPDFERKKGK